MKKVVGVVFLLVLGLWISSGIHSQQSVQQDQATVQAQQTIVAHPTASPTP